MLVIYQMQGIAIGRNATAAGDQAITVEQGTAVIGTFDRQINPRAGAICIGTGTVAYEGEIVIGTEEYTSVRIGGIDLVELLETNKRLCERIDVLECHVNALMEASTLDD